MTACRQPQTLQLTTFPGKLRDGHPRDNWWIEGCHEYWTHITNHKFSYYKGCTLDMSLKLHQAIPTIAAECHIGLKRDKDNELHTKTKIELGWIS